VKKLPLVTAPLEVEELKAKVLKFAKASLSSSTLKAYTSDWSDFEFWCRRTGLEALPAQPDTVALYLTKMSEHLKTSSLKRRVTAISKIHEFKKFPSPTSDIKVTSVMRGISRSKGIKQKHAEPTLLTHIQRMLASQPDSIKGIRDSAILLIGFSGGFRRSEIVSLNLEDLQIGEQGLLIDLRRSKTDQSGKGRKIAIAYGSNPETCPVLALEKWLKASSITSGPLFRPINKWGQLADSRMTDQSIRLILKDSLSRAGISEEGFSGHSLRAGFATVAAINGASERDIQKTTGHASLEVLRRYIRDADLFRHSASKKLGL
jgi:site-specific recombinase XerD